MTAAVSLLLVALLGVSFINWRAGVLVCVAVGFLADPLRKLTPEEPVYFVILVGVFLAVTFVAAARALGGFRFKSIGAYRALVQPMEILVAWVVLGAILTVVRYQSVLVAGIGLMAYVAPIPALLLAYWYGRDFSRVRTFLVFYVALCFLMQIGTYLSFLGFDWGIFRQVGTGIQIYTRSGVLESHTGFFRSPEVAAWHAGTAACLVFVMVTSRMIKIPALVGGSLVLYFLTAGVITGRRKMIVVVVVFLSLYLFFLLKYRRGARSMVALLVLCAGLATFGLSETLLPQEGVDPYLERTVTVFPEARERFELLGLGSIVWAYNRFGILGGGTGIASQGSQYFGGGGAVVGGAGEGGLGKIMCELGAPGLLLFAWIGLGLVRYLLRSLRLMTQAPMATARFEIGILALLAAQIPAFIVASQIYGDLFVLCILGFLLGFALALADRVAKHFGAIPGPQPAASRSAVTLRKLPVS